MLHRSINTGQACMNMVRVDDADAVDAYVNLEKGNVIIPLRAVTACAKSEDWLNGTKQSVGNDIKVHPG